MAKGKGFDPVADAHEVAEHNINPYYWVNKVTTFTYAKWMAEKKMAIIFAPFYMVFTGIIVSKIPEAFRNGYGLQTVAYLALWGFITVVEVIMVIQLWQSRGRKQAGRQAVPSPKKHHPKRRKDYH